MQQSTEVCEQLRAFVFADVVSPGSLPARPRLAILDVPEQRYHAVLWDEDVFGTSSNDDDPISESSLRCLVDDFKANRLRFVPLQRWDGWTDGEIGLDLRNFLMFVFRHYRDIQY